MGESTPALGELVRRGAEATLSELEAKDRARQAALDSFVDRLVQGPRPELDEVARIRHSTRAH
jgi:hypothetical protein